MADKYLRHNNGRAVETEATVTSTGASEAGKIVALDGTGKLDETMLPSGVGAEVKSMVASESLSAGEFINVWDDTGTLKMRKADAATNKPAHGFVLDAVTADASGNMYSDGINDQLTGLTGGPTMYLSATTPGGATATVPSGSGHIVQVLGPRLSDTEIAFIPDGSIIQLA